MCFAPLKHNPARCLPGVYRNSVAVPLVRELGLGIAEQIVIKQT